MSEDKDVAQKCTFCYDRLKNGLTPACAQACPTESIRFGPITELKKKAEARVTQLRRNGVSKAAPLRCRREGARRPERLLSAGR